MVATDRFSGRDQECVRDVQYSTTANLNARIAPGPDHFKELFAIEQTVFGVASVRTQSGVFGSTSGTSILANGFAHVESRAIVDALRCTNADDVVASIRPAQPCQDADDAQVIALLREVKRLIELGDGAVDHQGDRHLRSHEVDQVDFRLVARQVRTQRWCRAN